MFKSWNNKILFIGYKMELNKIIIAGSRIINNYNLVEQSIKESGFKIDEIVCGMANGPDLLGKQYGIKNNIPIKEFPAQWDDLTQKPCIIRYGKWQNKYNACAGYIRNEEMAKYSTHLILIWDGKSKGSKSMLDLAKKYNLIIFEKIVK